ncbi:MAG: outer membrane protein transport protein [Deltaproteobacteria bacterium]|nr:outer membrane protein transport protein [Deltaproteobacteria bacterium]MCW5808552.1 outer membrane protein transport protein [Deltaproteobacteria bacterium]
MVPALVCVGLGAHTASAGGLFLPGSGATSTARAGAAVASADDGEALSVNPAGLAKTTGWTLTVSASLVRYYMEFKRDGTYDDVAAVDVQGYEGQAYGTVVNRPKPPLGLGSFQPLPVIAVVSDLGGRVKGLRVAAGLYAPQGYPFRDMTQGYKFNTDTGAPPPTRYDVMKAESALLFPSLAVAYRVMPELDVGVRLSAGTANAKQQVAVWGTTGNVEESVRNDTLFEADVKDGFVPTFGAGVTWRPTRNLEFGAVYNSSADLRLKGTGLSTKGPSVDMAKVVGPIGDNPVTDRLRCAAEGDFELGGKVPACITLQLPQTATVAARYKFLDDKGELRGDVELDVGWENWGKQCKFDSAAGILADKDCASPGQLLVNLDAGLYVNGTFTEPLQVNAVNLGLQDVFTFRLGGSYNIPAGKNRITLRGGVGYDTRAAREGWLRASFDGAARVTTTVGAAYRAPKWELNIGGGAVLEGTNTNPGAGPGGALCNPTRNDPSGCVGDGSSHPPADRQGPDPTNPLFAPEVQFENPFNQGTIKSNYVLFMLGYTRFF